MLFMSLGSMFTISLGVLAVTSLIVAFVVVAEHRVTLTHDADEEARLLTLKVRHPWQYRAARVGRWLMRDVR